MQLNDVIRTEIEEEVLFYLKMTPKRQSPPEYLYEIIFIFDSSTTTTYVNSSNTISQLDYSPAMDDNNNSTGINNNLNKITTKGKTKT